MLAACFVNSFHSQATLTLEPKWLRTMMMMTTAMSIIIIIMLVPSVFVFGPESVQGIAPSDLGAFLALTWPPRGFQSRDNTDLGPLGASLWLTLEYLCFTA